MEEKYLEFQKLKTDKERWEWIATNQHLSITVYLDNDDTYAQFDADEEADYLMEFDEYIGWADGIFNVFEVFGIKALSV